MNSNDQNGTSAPQDPAQPDVAGQHKAKLIAVLEKNLLRREGAVLDDEVAVLNREHLARARAASQRTPGHRHH